MDEVAGLEKDGVERATCRKQLADRPDCLEAELRLDRREWMTEIGPVDLMCRDCDRRLGRRSRSSASGRSRRSSS